MENSTTDIKVGLNIDANTNSTHANNAFTDLNKNNHYRRGFTGHEHLNEQQLIHMNGRMYDYNLGRFLSVDPFIQSPANTQSMNTYAYIMNNPLAGTNPTGYCSAPTGSTVKRCATVDVYKTDGSVQSAIFSIDNQQEKQSALSVFSGIGLNGGAGSKPSVQADRSNGSEIKKAANATRQD